jgi:CarD family transcriptional regulator
MKFKVNQWVHDPLNGIGQVKSFETMTIGGEIGEFMLLSFTNPNFIARVPMNRLKERGVRPLASKAEIKRAFAVLKTKPKSYRMLWSQKSVVHETKLLSGDLQQIAEVVRDLHQGFQNPDCDQSYTEFQLYQKSLIRFYREIELVESIDARQAQKKILGALKVA